MSFLKVRRKIMKRNERGNGRVKLLRTRILQRGRKIGAFFTQKKEKVEALYWDQVFSMAAIGLGLYVLVQNNAAAKTLGTTILTTVQTTLQTMLTASY
jgi:hypothetical protein